MPNNEISEAFWLGVETVASVVLLIMTLSIFYSSNQLTNVMEQQKASEAILQDVREWRAYDTPNDFTLYESDVISVLNKYGSLSVRTPKVIILNGHRIKDKDNGDAPNVTDLVNRVLSSGNRYSCVLERDHTGIVVTVTFTAQQ